MKKYTDKATIEHGDKKIKGVHLVESWVKDGKLDKSNNYGLALPEGTWVGMFKIADETLWNDYVKTGGHVLGICGGYQMLGSSVHDPDGLEGKPGRRDRKVAPAPGPPFRQPQRHCQTSHRGVVEIDLRLPTLAPRFRERWPVLGLQLIGLELQHAAGSLGHGLADGA